MGVRLLNSFEDLGVSLMLGREHAPLGIICSGQQEVLLKCLILYLERGWRGGILASVIICGLVGLIT